MTDVPLSQRQYVTLAAFRHQLHQSLLFGENAAAAGLPTQQNQALLTLAGPDGTKPPMVGMLAERMIVAPPTAAEHVAHVVASGLTKTVSVIDRRRSDLSLTPNAAALLAVLTEAYLLKLKAVRSALTQVDHEPPGRLVRGATRATPDRSPGPAWARMASGP